MINPWLNWKPAAAPYVHPDDAGIVSKFNDGIDDINTEYRLQTQLLPEPFVGDLSKCCLLILGYNPGYEATLDKAAEDRVFRNAVLTNLRQESQEFPFFLIDPKFQTLSVGHWWRDALRGLIDAVSGRLRIDPDKAVKRVSERVAAADLHGYHSSKFYVRRNILELPTVKFTKHAVVEAKTRGCMILVARGWYFWEDTLLSEPLQVTRIGSTSAKVSPKSLGKMTFEAILQRICTDDVAPS